MFRMRKRCQEERKSARYDRYPRLWPETTFRCLRHHPLARRHATSSPNARKQRLTEVELEQEESEAESFADHTSPLHTDDLIE